MCGLSAFYNCGHCYDPYRDVGAKKDEETLNASLDIIQHRGPDARGLWISNDHRVGIGHVRLSIVDFSPGGNQPFHDRERGVHAVVNGELYGVEEERAELTQEYTFQGNSDCEFVVALYQKYGISLVNRLRGEFAFVLWDEHRQLFFAARDRYGIKPLYYTVLDGKILVASEMKCFLPYGWKPRWNLEALKEASWMFHGQTIFQDVYKIKPGHYLLSRRQSPIEESPYWDLEYPDKRTVETRTEEEMILGVRERLIDAVQARMRADVPIGIYLSGGVDSSAIAGILTHLMKQGVGAGSDQSRDTSKIKCFTVQFDADSGVDESDVARRTAEFLGLDFHTVHMNEDAMAARFEDAVWHSETLSPGTNGPGRLAISELAKAHGLRVILTGEGSDEHFGGYDYLIPELLQEPDLTWPHLPISHDALRKSIEASDTKDQYGQSKPKAADRPVNRMLNNTATAIGLRRYTPAPLAAWTETLATSPSDVAFAEGLDGVVREKIANKWHPLHTAEYTWARTILPNIILRYLADNQDMVYHVESRPPFLDHHLTEYANHLPPSVKIKYDPETKRLREKHVLREAVRPFITDEVYARKKQPYKGPPTYKMGGPMHRLISRLVTRQSVSRLGFIDWDDVQPILQAAFEGQDGGAVRQAVSVAQFVVMAQRFDIPAVERPCN